MKEFLMFGGGRQTVTMLALIARGILPKPDGIIMADTSRENKSTWDYKCEIVDPIVASLGMSVEVASHDYATVDLYAHNGDLLLPMFTETGKLPTFCSTEWKLRVCNRYIRDVYKLNSSGFIAWIGFAFDEGERVKRRRNNKNPVAKFPLSDLMLTTEDGLKILRDMGIPEPPVSSACYMCPNKNNKEWLYQKQNYPDDFNKAITIEKEAQEWDRLNGGNGKIYLHHSRMPLHKADLSVNESATQYRACGLGMCMV